MVKRSLYQCNNCKTVFLAKGYKWHYDGPCFPEPYYHEEEPVEKQTCPDCKSKLVSFIGMVHISRKIRKMLEREGK